jgi:RimJ/RimL family protein N-acetyltransferase
VAFEPATIPTARLVLTPLRADDADAMVEVLGDERLHEFIGGAPLGLADLRRRYEQLAAGSGDPDELWLNWIVRTRADRAAAGTVQATVTRDGAAWAAEVAWVIGVPWQGRGYAVESARALVGWLWAQGAFVVSANVHPDHVASAAVAARAGLGVTGEVVDGERVWRAWAPS